MSPTFASSTNSTDTLFSLRFWNYFFSQHINTSFLIIDHFFEESRVYNSNKIRYCDRSFNYISCNNYPDASLLQMFWHLTLRKQLLNRWRFTSHNYRKYNLLTFLLLNKFWDLVETFVQFQISTFTLEVKHNRTLCFYWHNLLINRLTFSITRSKY